MKNCIKELNLPQTIINQHEFELEEVKEIIKKAGIYHQG